MNTQNTETPINFFQEVEIYFGIRFTHDMAAGLENTKCKEFCSKEMNALSMPAWPQEKHEWCWLNPPFADLKEWVIVCERHYLSGSKIVTIWPLSGDLNMIPVWRMAQVNIIHGRVWPLVRGCMLCVWNKEIARPGTCGLRWDKKTLTKIWG